MEMREDLTFYFSVCVWYTQKLKIQLNQARVCVCKNVITLE